MRQLIPTHLPKVTARSILMKVKYTAEYLAKSRHKVKSKLSPVNDPGICQPGREHHPKYRAPRYSNLSGHLIFVFAKYQCVDGSAETKYSDFSFGPQNWERMILKFELDAIPDLSKSAALLPPVTPRKKQKRKKTEIYRLPSLPTILILSVRVGVRYSIHLSSHGAHCQIMEPWKSDLTQLSHL